MSQIDSKLDALAQLPVLLVASDYDGTLSEIVEDPSAARPYREALVALKSLAELPRTHVAVISGRSLADLDAHIGHPQHLHLVGSHGSEFDPGFAGSLDGESLRLRLEVESELKKVASRFTGVSLEPKPASVALHYRRADPSVHAEVIEAVEQGPAKLDGVHVGHGKCVVELSVISTNKGEALARLRHRLGASGAVFFGDDVTDERAFETLSGPDLGIKVGEGESSASARVSGPVEVARTLAALAERRSQWLAGAESTPIEEHAFLSDQRAFALVTPRANVSWYCAPRLDSPALFAELLGGPSAGHFSIEPLESSEPPKQRYVGSSMILETQYENLRITDYLDCSGGRARRRAGRSELVRKIEGSGRVRCVFAPRIDFGRVETGILVRDGGLEVVGAPEPIVLASENIEWTIEREGLHQTAIAEFDLDAKAVVFELRYGAGHVAPGTQSTVERERETFEYWERWTERLELPEIEPELVLRSALVLRALTYGPSGGIAAAATTSLPEHLGGVRNWDYRYVWLRDAALSAEALVLLGSHGEAMQYLDWVLDIVDSCAAPEYLRPLYSVTGHHLGPEGEIAELCGYAGSRPVRVGNAAGLQVQLDVFGPIVHLVWTLLGKGAPLSAEHWQLVEAMVCAVERRWHEPDHGIWEIRAARRHHVHSKIMCWVTVDRAEKIAREYQGQDRPDLRQLRDEIAADVLENGYKPELGCFTAAYDGEDLDAAALAVGLSGLVAPDDERFAGTVRAIERELRDGPTVYRYRSEDGLPGPEGGFHFCAQWLVEAYLLVGRRKEAEELFESIVALAGPTGLLTEQYDPETRRSLGNHPQAYSHLGLIRNALLLAKR